MVESMDVGSQGAAVAPRTKLYNICQIYKKAQIIKNLPETRLYKVTKVFLTQQLTKLSDFRRESGEFLSLVISLLLTAVHVAALTCSMLELKWWSARLRNFLKLL